jgi:DNA replication protein DnaC
MERTQLFDLMGELKLYGMKAAFDEIMTTAVKRQHEPQRIVGDLLSAEINEKHARSIKYQLTIAKLPLAKDLDDFQFEGTPINETLVNDLAGGGFIAQQRNAVLVGGTGTGKSHLAIAIARSCIRGGARGRFYNVVDLVNRLEGVPIGCRLTRCPRNPRIIRARSAKILHLALAVGLHVLLLSAEDRVGAFDGAASRSL